jgi:hypothetical protein
MWMGAAAVIALVVLLGAVVLGGGTVEPQSGAAITTSLSPTHDSGSLIGIQPTGTDTAQLTVTAPNQPFEPVADSANQAPEDPIRFVEAYINHLNAGDYETAFDWLAETYKLEHHCCNADGSYRIQPYINWWQNFSRIDIEQIEIYEQQTGHVVVYVYLRYHRIDGSVTDDQNYVHLSLENGEWRIVDWTG